MTAPRRAALAFSVVATACVALTGCGGGSGSSATSPPSTAAPATSAPAGGAAGSVGKLTGNFCTDLKDIGTSIKLPASAQGSLSAAKQNGAQYLTELGKYFNGLAAEAPPQVASSLHSLASDYQKLAAGISSGTYNSISKIQQQLQSLTTNSGAFSKLITYIATKCA